MCIRDSREILDESPFDLREIEVIAVENALSAVQVEVVLAQLVPRQLGDRFDVAHDDRIFRTGRWDVIETLQFALGLLEHCLWRTRFGELFAQLLDLLLDALLLLAEFALNRADLFAQIGTPLQVREFRADILLQLLLNSRDLELGTDLVVNRSHPPRDIQFLEQLLLLRRVEIQAVRHEVRELAGVGEVHQDRAQFLRRTRREFEKLQRRFPQTFHRGFPFGIANGRRDRLEHVDLGAQIRLRLHDAADAEALQGIDDQECGALGLPDELQNLAHRADAEEIFRSRLFGLDHPLPDHADHATLRRACLEQFGRVRAPDVYRRDRPGKD